MLLQTYEVSLFSMCKTLKWVEPKESKNKPVHLKLHDEGRRT